MSVICVYTISEMENFKSYDVEVLLPVGRNCLCQREGLGT